MLLIYSKLIDLKLKLSLYKVSNLLHKQQLTIINIIIITMNDLTQNQYQAECAENTEQTKKRDSLVDLVKRKINEMLPVATQFINNLFIKKKFKIKVSSLKCSVFPILPFTFISLFHSSPFTPLQY